MRIMVLGDRNELFGEFRTEARRARRGDSNVEGLSQGALGKFGEGCFLTEVGKYIEISLLCVREVLNNLRELRASVRGFRWWRSCQCRGRLLGEICFC